MIDHHNVSKAALGLTQGDLWKHKKGSGIREASSGKVLLFALLRLSGNMWGSVKEVKNG